MSSVKFYFLYNYYFHQLICVKTVFTIDVESILYLSLNSINIYNYFVKWNGKNIGINTNWGLIFKKGDCSSEQYIHVAQGSFRIIILNIKKRKKK